MELSSRFVTLVEPLHHFTFEIAHKRMSFYLTDDWYVIRSWLTDIFEKKNMQYVEPLKDLFYQRIVEEN